MNHSALFRLSLIVAMTALLSMGAMANASADWPNFHHDAGHTGFDGQNVIFNGASKDWTSAGLDGAVYAQPLVVGSTVYVATENNSVYAFDAASGATLWHYNAGTPESGARFGCGNIDPNGITGTPVVDSAAGRLYAVATIDVGGTPRYELITLNTSNGTLVGSPITLTYTGFSSRTQGQRGALALANNMVYVPFGGRDGDCTPYDGVIFGVPVGGGTLIHYTTPSNGTGAGMWSSGGIETDGSGNLFVSTGNADLNGCTSQYVFDDSVLKLSSTLARLDQFAPTNWSSLSCADADLGSTAPLLLGNGLVFIQGKESTAYLLNQSPLGSTYSGGTLTAGGQAFAGSGCSSMAFGAAAYMAPYVYVPCNTGGLLALNVNATAKTFSKAWQATNGKGGPPIVAGGAVWQISGGTLHGFDPSSGKSLFTDSVGSFASSFPTPAAGDGRLFVANDSNLIAYFLNPVCIAPSTPTVTGGTGSTTFYFAEGFTAPGFNECLAMLMPNTSGTATIDYWTATTHTLGTVAMTAGQVATVNVNAVVGSNQQVSVRVTLPGPGIAERLLDFTYGQWHGSTDIVGATAPNTEWDFAEGSTLSIFNEYLTLQNPNAVSVAATLSYMTDSGAHPTKTVNLPPNSRTTVEVFNGDTVNDVNPCTPSGTGANCGVGHGIGGVSVKVTTPSGQPIVAERPFYVDNHSFGWGPINDGHVAFGANGPATTWNFAEGTTLDGFNEFLTIQNPNTTTAANITLRYIDQNATVTTKSLTVNPLSRFTVEVFNSQYGVGTGVGGVSVQVTSTNSVGIVAERPMYIYHNFGTGIVGGATDVLGATGLGTLFGFAAASSTTGDFDYLTLQNPGASAATVSIDYYTGSGKVTKPVTVNPNTRVTVETFHAANGVGAGQSIFGLVVTSTNAVPILVEKPTYSSDPFTYGATDTMGYSPASF